MEHFLIEIDVSSILLPVVAETEEEALDKAYVKFNELIKSKGLQDVIKGYPIEMSNQEIPRPTTTIKYY